MELFIMFQLKIIKYYHIEYMKLKLIFHGCQIIALKRKLVKESLFQKRKQNKNTRFISNRNWRNICYTKKETSTKKN